MDYDIDQEVIRCINELYYRDGYLPKDILLKDIDYVTETIKRYIKEAYEAGYYDGF